MRQSACIDIGRCRIRLRRHSMPPPPSSRCRIQIFHICKAERDVCFRSNPTHSFCVQILLRRYHDAICKGSIINELVVCGWHPQVLAFCAVFVHRQDPGALVCHQNGKGCSIDCSSNCSNQLSPCNFFMHLTQAASPNSTVPCPWGLEAPHNWPSETRSWLLPRDPSRLVVAQRAQQLLHPWSRSLESFSPVVLSCAVPCFVSILCTLRLPTSPALRRSAISQAVDFRDPTRFNRTRSTIPTINTPKPSGQLHV